MNRNISLHCWPHISVPPASSTTSTMSITLVTGRQLIEFVLKQNKKSTKLPQWNANILLFIHLMFSHGQTLKTLQEVLRDEPTKLQRWLHPLPLDTYMHDATCRFSLERNTMCVRCYYNDLFMFCDALWLRGYLFRDDWTLIQSDEPWSVLLCKRVNKVHRKKIKVCTRV